jgi:hypothetical protein
LVQHLGDDEKEVVEYHVEVKVPKIAIDPVQKV